MAGALVLKFGTDIEPARRGLQTLAQTAQANFGVISAAGRSLTAEMAKTSTAMRAVHLALEAQQSPLGAAVGGIGRLTQFMVQHRLAIGLAVGAWLAYQATAGIAIEVAREKLAEYVKLAEAARDVDVGTTFYQQFTQIAGTLDDANNKVKTLAEGLKAAANQFREGALSEDNPIIRLLQGSNFASAGQAADVVGDRNASAEAKIKAVVAAIDDMIAAGHRVEAFKLGEALFGQAAFAALMERVDTTKRGIADLVAESKPADIVPPEVIQRAKDLEEQLDAAKKQLRDDMKPLMNDLVSLGTEILAGWQAVEVALISIVGKAAQLYSSARGIAAELRAAGADFQKNFPNIARGLGAPQEPAPVRMPQLVPTGGFLNPYRQETASEYAARVLRAENPVTPATIPDTIPGLNRSVTLPTPPDRPNIKPEAAGGGRARTAAEATRDAERLIEQLEKQIRLEKVEMETAGQSNEVKERARALAKMTGDETAAEAEKIGNLGAAYGKLKDAIEAAEKKQQEFKQGLQEVSSEFAQMTKDVLLNNADIGKSFQNLLKNFAGKGIDRLFNMLLGGGGGSGGGLLDGLFKSVLGSSSVGAPMSILPRAAGGDVGMGRPYLVGENGPELFVPGASGSILPRVGGGGGGTNFTIVQHIAANGTEEVKRAAFEAAQAVVASNNRNLPAIQARQARRAA